MLNTDGDVKREREAIRVLREKRVDGLLVVPASRLEVDHLAGGRGHGAPVVLFDRFVDDLPIDSVITADYEASRAAIRLLIENGHRRIGLLLGTAAHHGHQESEPYDTVSAVRERARGAMDELAEAGVPVSPAWIRYAGSVASTALSAARHLLAQSPRLTAILAGNEEMLLGALAAAEEIDLTIGRDLSLISFDDAPWLAVFRPPLSVVQRPTYELGRQAVSLLLSKVAGDRSHRPIVLSANLINRASVARIDP